MTRPTLDPQPPPPAKDCPVAADSPLWDTAREVAMREISRVGADGNPCAAAAELVESMRTSSRPRLYGMDDSCNPKWASFACLCHWYATQSEAERAAIRGRIKRAEWYWVGTVTPPTLPCDSASQAGWCCSNATWGDPAYESNPPATGPAQCPRPKTPWYKQTAVIAAGVIALSAGAITGVFMVNRDRP